MSGAPKQGSNFLKNVLPFGALVLGAFIGLTEFRKINYGFPKNNDMSVFKENLKQVGLSEESYQYQATQGLDEEYKKTMDNIKLDRWKNIR
jgi:hypothetical protein